MERPLIRYPGSKFLLYSKFLRYFIDSLPHDVYIEPFGGGGAVLLNKKPSSVEIYNDIDKRLVGLFRVLQDPEQSSLLIYKLKHTLYSEEELKKATLMDVQNANPIDLAWATYVKSWFGFGTNSIHRKTFQFKKTPASESGVKKKYNYALSFADMVDALPFFTERLRRVEIRHEDALELISAFAHLSGVLMYLDPPYLLETLSVSEYYSHKEAYSPEYHKKIAEVLNDSKAYVLISGYPNDLYNEIFEKRGWKRFDYDEAYTQKRGNVRSLFG